MTLELRAFAYQSAHLDYLRRRLDWFQPHDFPASLVLWWIPAGHIPAVEEACERLELVAAGPSPAAFTFRRTFPPPSSDGGSMRSRSSTMVTSTPH